MTKTCIIPSEPLLHVTSVCDAMLAIIPGIWVTLTFTMPKHPISEVMVQVYAPTGSPVAVCVVCAFGSFQRYERLPRTGTISAKAVPSFPPGQETRVVVP